MLNLDVVVSVFFVTIVTVMLAYSYYRTKKIDRKMRENNLDLLSKYSIFSEISSVSVVKETEYSDPGGPQDVEIEDLDTGNVVHLKR